mgnify:CR=1 FL=1
MAEPIPVDSETGVPTISGLETIFSNVVSVAVAFAGIVFLIMLLIGGFSLITAGSEAPKAEAAKKTITYAIFGFIFVAVSYLILQLIKSFTGVDVTNFTIVQP